MSKAFVEGLRELREGARTFRDFYAASTADFDRMAVDIARSWEVPAGVDEEDVRQELLLAIVEKDLVARWDPKRRTLTGGRGPTLERFVVWQSYTAAKRFIHRQRGALRRDGKAQSRHPLAFAGLHSERSESMDYADRGFEGVTEATQHEQLEARELAAGFRMLLGGDRERAAFDVLLAHGGTVGETVATILDNAAIAAACRVGDEAEALELVMRTLEEMRRLVHEVLTT